MDTDKIADKVEDLHLDKKAEEVADKGKGFLDQVAVSHLINAEPEDLVFMNRSDVDRVLGILNHYAQATLNSVANTIDEKTKSAGQPGKSIFCPHYA